MATTTNLNSLVINYLTQAQYDSAVSGGTIDANQLYLTPESGTSNYLEKSYTEGSRSFSLGWTTDDIDTTFSIRGLDNSNHVESKVGIATAAAYMTIDDGSTTATIEIVPGQINLSASTSDYSAGYNLVCDNAGGVYINGTDGTHVYAPLGVTGTLALTSDVPGVLYGTSSTTASTAAKVVTCSNFTTGKNSIIGILFSTANTAATPTLNVNSTGAKSIYVGSATPTATDNVLKWSANTMVYFLFDGTYFRYITSVSAGSVVSSRGANTWYGTSSTSASTQAKTSTIDNFVLTKGALVSITFSTANTYTSAKITLNINSTGAKDIYYNNAVTSSSNTLLWNAGETVTFMYNGTGYYFVAKTPPSIILNGSSTISASFYAPTSAGTSGYYLKSNGSGAPTWSSTLDATKLTGTVPTSCLPVYDGTVEEGFS